MELTFDPKLLSVAKRYVKPFFEIAVEKKRVKVFFSDLKRLEEVLNVNDEFKDFLTSPVVDINDKFDVIEQGLRGKISNDSVTFVKVLTEAKRLGALSAVIYCYGKLLDGYENTLGLTVRSAVTLDFVTKTRLKTVLEVKLGKTINSEYVVDESLIGGIVLDFEDEVVDGSVLGELNKFERKVR